MYAYYFRSMLDGEQSRRKTGRKPVVGRPPGDRAKARLARPARHHGHAQGGEFHHAAQQRQVVIQRLAETESRIDGNALSLYAGGLAGLDAPRKIVAYLAQHIRVARRLLHRRGLALLVHEAHPAIARGHSLERAWRLERLDV